VEIGLIAGITASVMAKRVFHWAGVSGFSDGRGGNGVAFGDTGSVGRDIVGVVGGSSQLVVYGVSTKNQFDIEMDVDFLLPWLPRHSPQSADGRVHEECM
jgi:hypothetical protein